MYAAVPMVLLAPVSAVTSRSLAMPKSVSLSMPSRVIIRFDGFRSRWMMPFSWACCRALTKLLDVADDFLPAEPAAAGQHAVERFAVDELHRDERRLLVPPRGDQPHDVRMLELLEDVGLALEPGHRPFVAEQAERDDLQGDGLDVSSSFWNSAR